jgi:molybdate transport system permease protein
MNLTSKIAQGYVQIARGTLAGLRENSTPASVHRTLAQIPDRSRVGNLSIWLLVLPGFLLTALFGLPLLGIAAKAAGGEFFKYVLSPQVLTALRLSLITSLITVLITILGGTPLAYILARWKFSPKPYLELLIDLPVVLPPSVAGVALLITFGRQGLVGPFLGAWDISLPFTTAAVILAQTFVAAPLYVRAARIGFSEIDIQIEEAARVEGANQWQLFCHVMFPIAGRALISGAALTWARALGEFGATMLFAGNLEGVTQTMPMAIYLGFERNLGIAIALSMLLIGISVIFLGITRRLEAHEY